MAVCVHVYKHVLFCVCVHRQIDRCVNIYIDMFIWSSVDIASMKDRSLPY